MKTDAQIKQDVLHELAWEPSIQAAQIGVEVRDGMVTLAGQVASHIEKFGAEQAAQRVAGVRALAIEITVSLPGASVRTDSVLARDAQQILDWTSNVPDQAIKVMAEGGWLTLSGAVDWDYQRRAALNAVRSLTGVTGVQDAITLAPHDGSNAVVSAIEVALERGAQRDSHRIRVEMHGGEVTLSGQVANWSERELAQHAAWSAPGVSLVIDRLTLLA